MNITARMIFDVLSEKYDATFFGARNSTELKRPMLFEPDQPLESGHIFVASNDYLPVKPDFSPKDLLICVGQEPRRVYTLGNFPVIWLKNAKFLSAFNRIQEVYDNFVHWEQSLDKIIASTLDFAEITRISLPFIQNPIAILDEQFYHIAIARWKRGPRGSTNWKVEAPMFPLPMERINQVSEARSKNSNVLGIYTAGKSEMEKNPDLPEDLRDSVELRCANLFVTGRHMGTITVASYNRPFRDSDDEIILFFKTKVEEALTRRANVRTVQTATLKSVISDYLKNEPVSNYRLQHVTINNQEFICAKVMQTGKNANLPVDYVCATIEGLLSGSVALEFASCIVVVVDFSLFPYEYEKFFELFNMFLKEMGYKAGLSERFTSISEVAIHHKQAVCAYEIGTEVSPDESIYDFWDYALLYMLRYGQGDFSLKYIIPPELKTLQKKSQDSVVNYWGTLKCYLDNNMNASKTARDLYLHRSSFLVRLEQINAILGKNLDDPMKRLWYRMIMYLQDVECPEN